MNDFNARVLSALESSANSAGEVSASYEALAQAIGEPKRWRDAYQALGSLKDDGELVKLERSAGQDGKGVFRAIVPRRADGEDSRGRLLNLLSELQDDLGWAHATVGALAEAMDEGLSYRDVHKMVLVLRDEGAFLGCEVMGMCHPNARVRVRVS